MLWKGRRESDNVEDLRGSGGIGGKVIGGGIGTIIIAIIVYFLGGDPGQVLQESPTMPKATQDEPYQETQSESEAHHFVSVVLAETEDVWTDIFRKMGKTYQKPTLALFNNFVESACGNAEASMGPFYCPADEKVYIDLSFYDELKNRFHAPGDFTMAYVVAHEVGHHVQNLLGVSEQMQELRSRLSEKEYNQLSVRLELQADFYAGVWAHYTETKGIVEPGDIDEALNAAQAIGDDRLQKQSQGYIVPDAFTHGTSAQRMKWFKKGYETGDVRQGNTFDTEDL